MEYEIVKESDQEGTMVYYHAYVCTDCKRVAFGVTTDAA